MRSHRHTQTLPAISRRTVLSLLALGTATTTLAACRSSDGSRENGAASKPRDATAGAAATTDYSARFAAFQPADAPNGDLAAVVWPSFIIQTGPEVKRLYEFQILNGDLMRYMPCFCGCQWEDNHRNNRDCYIDRINPDGSVQFDAMAPT